MTSQFSLSMRAGPHAGKSYELTDREITIGRDINADIVINIPEVSRRHARLQLETGGYTIEDLGSTNGTFVNGQRVTGIHMLQHGDTIMLGEAVTFGYEGGEEFDPNATMVSPSSSAATVNVKEPISVPPPKPAYSSQPAAPKSEPVHQAPPPAEKPAYSGQVPAGPMDAPPSLTPESMQDEGGKKRTWLFAGIGCAVIGLCVVAGGAIVFDVLNLYCTPPFSSIFSFLYTCP